MVREAKDRMSWVYKKPKVEMYVRAYIYKGI